MGFIILNSVSIPFKREGASKLIAILVITFGGCVSIPFKREGASKLEFKSFWKTLQSTRFNSLQTGRRIQTRKKFCFSVQNHHVFQFPSNGKAHPNIERKVESIIGRDGFQFPSNGKAHPNQGSGIQQVFGYNEFQFPSNGKAHPNYG